MIGEALAWALTPCPFYVRRLGLLSESIAISARHRRCRTAWAPHLAEAKAAIREAIGRTPRRRMVLVMGSGALLDVPLPELAAAFERVILVDLIHPWPARLKAGTFANVTRVTDDVTGTLDAAARGELVRPRPFPRLADPEIDLAISLNLLSQLPLVPVHRFEDRIDDAVLGAAVQDLIRSHLADLDRAAASTLLISDVERIVVNGDGREVERTSLIADLAEPVADRQWRWDIAPAPEADPVTSEYRRVIARFVPGAFQSKSLQAFR